MKHSKISFLLVLAVLTIGLNAATNVEVFKTESIYNCRQGIDFISGDFKLPTAVTVFTGYNDGFFAPENGINTICPGEATYCAKNLIPSSKNFQCTSGTDEFCCAEILTPPSPCGTDPNPPGGSDDNRQFQTKVKIWCKTTDILFVGEEYPD